MATFLTRTWRKFSCHFFKTFTLKELNISIQKFENFTMKIMKGRISGIYDTFVQWCLMPILWREYVSPSFNKINERATEYAFVFKHLRQICPTEVLDVGTGRSALPHLMSNCGFRVTAIDEMRSYWKGGFRNRHYYIIKDSITNPKIKKKFDLITCISVLEHIPNHQAAVKGMFKLLKSGGYLILTFPCNEKQYVNNVYKLLGAGHVSNPSYICQVYSRKEIDKWLQENKGKIIDQEYYKIFTGDLWNFGERIYPPLKVSKQEKHHLQCILIQRS